MVDLTVATKKYGDHSWT